MAASKTCVSVSDIHPPSLRLPISQAVISDGSVYVSGVVGCDPKNTKVVEGGIRVETRVALEYLAKSLAAAGTTLANVVKVNVYLADFDRDFTGMNEVYAQVFGTENLPARTCIGVAKLPLNSNVEIECVAALPR